MKVLYPPGEVLVSYGPLAREIGLAESIILLTMITQINKHGVRKQGRHMVALETKQLEALFPWATVTQVKKTLDSLCSRGFMFISDNTLLLTDSTRWYGLNYSKIRTLKSLVVLADEQVTRDVPAPEPKPEPESDDSRLYKAVYGALMRTCNFDSGLMTPRDRGETGIAAKKLIAADRAMFPDHDTQDLIDAIEAFPVWWIKIEGAKYHTVRTAPRPATVQSNWTRYIDYCQQNLDGGLPE